MSDIDIRRIGRAGRITLTREGALNALTPDMIARIDAALRDWSDDPAVEIAVIDAAGRTAFCAGGDIAFIHRAAIAGDLETPRAFWRAEYRMNARLAAWPKPVVSFLQGFTLGGGVGVGCHASHRIVGATSRIALPECAVGLVPDVGGSLLLARAPGRIGEYLGVSAHRMGPTCAIHAGFADHFVPEDRWPGLLRRLERTGDPALVREAAGDPGQSDLAAHRDWIDARFAAATLAEIESALREGTDTHDVATLAELDRVSPLAAATTLPLIRKVRELDTMEGALDLEYRAAFRAVEDGDLIEGIRAALIDRDRAPRWRHASIREVPQGAARAMLAPLGPRALDLAGTR